MLIIRLDYIVDTNVVDVTVAGDFNGLVLCSKITKLCPI